jgi:hypothetical protein
MPLLSLLTAPHRTRRHYDLHSPAALPSCGRPVGTSRPAAPDQSQHRLAFCLRRHAPVMGLPLLWLAPGPGVWPSLGALATRSAPWNAPLGVVMPARAGLFGSHPASAQAVYPVKTSRLALICDAVPDQKSRKAPPGPWSLLAHWADVRQQLPPSAPGRAANAPPVLQAALTTLQCVPHSCFLQFSRVPATEPISSRGCRGLTILSAPASPSPPASVDQAASMQDFNHVAARLLLLWALAAVGAKADCSSVAKPELFGYSIAAEYPHDPTAFTQGAAWG